MPPTVHARVPLSLLQALREVDSPEGEAEAEYVDELRNKRLGLSNTVFDQIRKYVTAVKEGRPIAIVEATGISTLIGRRADAEKIFQAAGRRLAADMIFTIPAPLRRIIPILPGFLARPMALSQIRKIAAKFMSSSVNRTGSSLILAVHDSVSVDSAPRAIGCTYYESAFRELLRRTIHGGGAVEHVRCASRGEGACEWRADWRITKREA